MLVADAVDVLRALAGEAEEGADVLGTLGELGEQRSSLGLAGSFGSRLLLALPSTEHGHLSAGGVAGARDGESLA